VRKIQDMDIIGDLKVCCCNARYYTNAETKCVEVSWSSIVSEYTYWKMRKGRQNERSSNVVSLPSFNRL